MKNIDSEDVDTWVNRNISMTQELIDDPIDDSPYPPPGFWDGYMACLKDLQLAVKAWQTA